MMLKEAILLGGIGLGATGAMVALPVDTAHESSCRERTPACALALSVATERATQGRVLEMTDALARCIGE